MCCDVNRFRCDTNYSNSRGSQITPAGTFLAEWASHLIEVAHDIDTALGSLRIEGTQRLTLVARRPLCQRCQDPLQVLPQRLNSLADKPFRSSSG
jgi:hypothetical protein